MKLAVLHIPSLKGALLSCVFSGCIRPNNGRLFCTSLGLCLNGSIGFTGFLHVVIYIYMDGHHYLVSSSLNFHKM